MADDPNIERFVSRPQDVVILPPADDEDDQPKQEFDWSRHQ